MAVPTKWVMSMLLRSERAVSSDALREIRDGLGSMPASISVVLTSTSAGTRLAITGDENDMAPRVLQKLCTICDLQRQRCPHLTPGSTVQTKQGHGFTVVHCKLAQVPDPKRMTSTPSQQTASDGTLWLYDQMVKVLLSPQLYDQ